MKNAENLDVENAVCECKNAVSDTQIFENATQNCGEKCQNFNENASKIYSEEITLSTSQKVGGGGITAKNSSIPAENGSYPAYFDKNCQNSQDFESAQNLQNKCKKLNDKELRNKKENFKNAHITYDECTYLNQSAKEIGSIMQKSKNNNFNDTKFDARAASVAEVRADFSSAQLDDARVASVEVSDTTNGRGDHKSAKGVGLAAAVGKKSKQCVAGGRVAHVNFEKKFTATICAWLFLFVACLAVTIGFGCMGNGGLKVLPADEGITTEAAALFSGSGTAASPYLISSQANLEALANTTAYTTYYASGVNYKLTTEFTLTDWNTPIGTEAHPFCGTFNFDFRYLNFSYSTITVGAPLFGYLDGAYINGSSGGIKNFNVTANADGYAGALAYVATDTTVYLIYPSDGQVSSAIYAGGIFGASNGTTTITQGNISNSNICASHYAGGYVGISYGTTSIQYGALNNVICVSGETSNIASTETGYKYVGYKGTNSTITISDTAPFASTCTYSTGYSISNVSDLNSLSSMVNNGFDFDGVIVTLTADIDGASSSTTFTTSIGTKEFPFRGTFNFNYGEITITRPLFNYIESATINNGYIHGSITGTATFTGAIANVAVNSTVQTIFANSCILTGTQFVGSYFGYAKGSSIKNCNMNDSTFKGYYAGMIGYADGINVIDGGFVEDSIFYSGVGDTTNTLNGKCGAGFKTSAATFKNGSGNAISTISVFNTATVTSTTITGYTGVVVTIDINGGDPDQDISLAIPKSGSSAVSLPTNLTKTDTTFTGYLSLSTGNTINTSNYNPTTSETILVQWGNVIRIVIVYKDADGGGFSGTHASSYPTTHVVGVTTTLDTPTRAGYTFEGYYLNDSTCAASSRVTTIASTYEQTITLYAKWEPIIITITLTCSNYSTATPNYMMYIYKNDSIVCQVVPTSATYQLKILAPDLAAGDTYTVAFVFGYYGQFSATSQSGITVSGRKITITSVTADKTINYTLVTPRINSTVVI